MAGVELATAYYSLVPSMAGTAAAVRGQMGVFDGVGAAAGARMGGAMGGGLLAAAKKFAAPVAAIFAGLGVIEGAGATFSFFDESVAAASDLAESGNAVKVSFGAAATEIEKLGENSAERLGLSRRQFNEIATRFSGFASTIAGQGGNVAGVIDQLSTRGADFASVFNLEVADALTLFQSGLAGETEPLRRYGIDLSAATVEAYAHANGIGAVGAELTETEKVQARYLLLMEETAKTEGDWANTKDELAGSQKQLNAKWEDATAKLGEELLPLWQEFTGFLVDTGIPLFEDLVEIFGPGFRVAGILFGLGLKAAKVGIDLFVLAVQAAIDGFSFLLRLLGVPVPRPNMPKIPVSPVVADRYRAASGAYVPSQRGGAALTVGEGRHDEVVLPLNAAVYAEIGRNIPGGGGPKTLVVVDSDGALIGRMQVEAEGRIAAYDSASEQTVRGGVIR